ncbi:unnamed protein product [Prunus brigantina]
MWLGNEPSNWGTNSHPARTDEESKPVHMKTVLHAQTTHIQGEVHVMLHIILPPLRVHGNISLRMPRISTYPNHIIIFPASHNSRILSRSTQGQTTQSWSNGPAGPTTSKFRSESSYRFYKV